MLQHQTCRTTEEAHARVALEFPSECGACGPSHSASLRSQLQCTATVRDFLAESDRTCVSLLPGCCNSDHVISASFEWSSTVPFEQYHFSQRASKWETVSANQMPTTSIKRAVSANMQSNDMREFRGRVQLWQPRNPSNKAFCASYTSRPTCQKRGDLTEFTFKTISQNNLAGLGPNLGDRREVRVDRVATLRDGKVIDMVVVAMSKYTVRENRQNRIIGDFLQINVRTGTDVIVELRFVETGTDLRVTLEEFRLDVMDFDQGHDGGARETVQVLSPLASYFVTPDTQVLVVGNKTMPTFTSTEYGIGKTNPDNAELLDDEQRARTLALTFKQTSFVRMRLAASAEVDPSWDTGRNLIFSGRPSAVLPVCLEAKGCLTKAYTSSQGHRCFDRECHMIPASGIYKFSTSMGAVGGRAVVDASLHIQSLAYAAVAPVDVALPLSVSNTARSWQLSWAREHTHHLDTAWLVRDDTAKSAPTGIVASARPQWASLLGAPGALSVTVYRGMDAYENPAPCKLQTVRTGAGGTFAFAKDSLEPGLYTLRVTPNIDVKFAFDSYNVLWNDQDVQLTMLVTEVQGSTTVASKGSPISHALLTWDVTTREAASLGLLVAFGAAPNLCEVHNGRASCGGVDWSEGVPGSYGKPGSQLATLYRWRSDTIYAMYIGLAERRCDGYNLPSSTQLRGGVNPTVNCNGDCVTGEGYCYSAPDGLKCAQCRLWPSKKPTVNGVYATPAEDVLCYDYGRPQGGPLKGSQEWVKRSCNTAAWNVHNVTARAERYKRCSGRLGQTRAKLWLVEAGKLVHSYPVLQDNDNVGYSFDAEKMGCLAVTSNGVKVALPESGTPLNLNNFLADRQNPQKSCWYGASARCSILQDFWTRHHPAPAAFTSLMLTQRLHDRISSPQRHVACPHWRLLRKCGPPVIIIGHPCKPSSVQFTCTCT